MILWWCCGTLESGFSRKFEFEFFHNFFPNLNMSNWWCGGDLWTEIYKFSQEFSESNLVKSVMWWWYVDELRISFSEFQKSNGAQPVMRWWSLDKFWSGELLTQFAESNFILWDAKTSLNHRKAITRLSLVHHESVCQNIPRHHPAITVTSPSHHCYITKNTNHHSVNHHYNITKPSLLHHHTITIKFVITSPSHHCHITIASPLYHQHIPGPPAIHQYTITAKSPHHHQIITIRPRGSSISRTFQTFGK